MRLMFRNNFIKFSTTSFSSCTLLVVRNFKTDAKAVSKYEPPSSILVPEKQFQKPSLVGKNLMRLLTEEEIKRRPLKREKLFRKNKEGVRAGDVLLVESYTHMGSESTSTFAGVCIAVRRQGVDTNFTLRNIIMKVGVEIRYSLYSPMIKDIKILQKGEGFRRAKLYYLREQPEKAFQIGGLLKKESARRMEEKKEKEKEKEKATAKPTTNRR
ncbi:hypothetical protein Glove_144g69 [Diversispora epigaea]|uniref:KOW domain-containing protein n=1 Tax=Diversispora epigaea TaxID=1348612 RepID=A0A397IUB0_9GLOM|nr:hypothetical protein Glove_144g69 [Diversispora epigaea]